METIKSNKDIDVIFKNGKKIYLPFLNIIFLKDEEQKIKGKVAFIAGKKNGNAVWRNKSKRKLREIYRELKIKEEYKTLLIANKEINEWKFIDIMEKVKEETKKYAESN